VAPRAPAQPPGRRSARAPRVCPAPGQPGCLGEKAVRVAHLPLRWRRRLTGWGPVCRALERSGVPVVLQLPVPRRLAGSHLSGDPRPSRGSTRLKRSRPCHTAGRLGARRGLRRGRYLLLRCRQAVIGAARARRRPLGAGCGDVERDHGVACERGSRGWILCDDEAREMRLRSEGALQPGHKSRPTHGLRRIGGGLADVLAHPHAALEQGRARTGLLLLGGRAGAHIDFCP
jgi:hypothetical protein